MLEPGSKRCRGERQWEVSDGAFDQLAIWEGPQWWETSSQEQSIRPVGASEFRYNSKTYILCALHVDLEGYHWALENHFVRDE